MMDMSNVRQPGGVYGVAIELAKTGMSLDAIRRTGIPAVAWLAETTDAPVKDCIGLVGHIAATWGEEQQS